MKHITLLAAFVVFACAGMNAQQAKKGVTVVYSQFELSTFPQPNAGASQSALFLGGHIEKGKKEQFGVVLGNSQTAVIEFLDAGNKVIKAMTAGDILGKSSVGAKLLRSTGDELGTHSEAVYEAAFPQGKAEIVIRSIASGERKGSKAKLTMSFNVKGSVGDIAAVRVSLPIEGQATGQENGFVVSSKAQSAAFSAAVFPKPKSVVAEKNTVVITADVPRGSDAKAGVPVLWMVVEGAGGANPAAVKAEAAASLKANGQYAADPNLIIVTTANKTSTQPSDTVTYSLICTNIGLGNATDVVLSNPIPAGTSYLEGSAEGQGTGITIDREKAAAPQLGAAKSVSWKLNEPLKPGAEMIVRFKIIVR